VIYVFLIIFLVFLFFVILYAHRAHLVFSTFCSMSTKRAFALRQHTNNNFRITWKLYLIEFFTGILGKEGRQAARCSDFALARFSFLKKAILVHGHWYYVRLSNLAIYFFYKNLVFILPQVFFCFHSKFSTQVNYTINILTTMRTMNVGKKFLTSPSFSFPGLI